jgi:three-Cys-motif partner protein
MWSIEPGSDEHNRLQNQVSSPGKVALSLAGVLIHSIPVAYVIAMTKRLPKVWTAEAHTKAKIAILKSYLHAWFRILALSRRDQTILYVDGFAGPGYYTNHEEGSPLAAVAAAQSTIADLGAQFIARGLHCAFIEKDSVRYGILKEALAPHFGQPKLGLSHHHCEFVDGIERVRQEVPGPFQGQGPLFIFADPFGGTGIPLCTFASCMGGGASELLINLDADGIGRIFQADNPNRDEQLTDLFGDESWRQTLNQGDPLPQLSLKILNLYKLRLRTLPGVKHLWSFAMRGAQDNINYHLVFVTKHSRGLEKMKEAMRAIDQTGTYSFSDAHAEQHTLFRDDDEAFYTDRLWSAFQGKTVSYGEVHLYALDETPFLNGKSMLRSLEQQGRVEPKLVAGVNRKKGDFSSEKIHSLHFTDAGLIPVQGDLFS